ncbi:MAG TPA: hypothetical protein VNP72_04880 [Longimicrobium sp.]|nr:hypothetical protein [Longimicrobium sp.]
MNANAHPDTGFVVCIRNDDYEFDLALNKVYRVLPDDSAARSGWIRIVDETGEDYLYPGEFFQAVDVSQVEGLRGAA